MQYNFVLVRSLLIESHCQPNKLRVIFQFAYAIYRRFSVVENGSNLRIIGLNFIELLHCYKEDEGFMSFDHVSVIGEMVY